MKPAPKKTKPRVVRAPKTRHLTGPGHCLRMLNVLSDYLDRGAKARLCSRIEEHLRECPECRVYVDTMRKTVVLYRSLGDDKVPAPVEKRLFKTIRLAELKKGRAGRSARPIKSSQK